MRARIVLPLLAVVFSGCDMLQTRTPQQPVQQSAFSTPTSPEIVIQNFENAVDGRDAVSYTRCFSDSTRSFPYRFFPAADAQQYAVTFTSWTVGDETSYFKNLVAQTPAENSFGVFLDSLVTITSSADSTVYSAAYTLHAQQTDPSKPVRAHGVMRLTVKADPLTQLWAITQWIDIADSPDPSWSVMKARFVQ